MAAEGGYNMVRFTYTGAEGEVIPDEATHITIDKSCTFVHAEACSRHPNIIELVCHLHVEKIERCAFYKCPNLRRVIMPGVKIAEAAAFLECFALTDVECGKLEIIEGSVFHGCKSLMIINLPSARIVEEHAFSNCSSVTEAHFGRNLETIEQYTFFECFSLERITIPLKNGLFAEDDAFMACVNLNQVDLVEGAVLQETVSSLQLEEWRADLNGVIDSINRVLPKARAGRYDYGADPVFVQLNDPGLKARAIRWWIRSVLGKIVHYKAKHQRILDGAATRLQLALPRDIVMNSVLPFVQLPPHKFEGEEDYSLEGEEGEDEDEEGGRDMPKCCCCIQ
eukprot:scaffold2832_cov132-Skeletonema_dohrnii-CCMP3373.AAC.5